MKRLTTIHLYVIITVPKREKEIIKEEFFVKKRVQTMLSLFLCAALLLGVFTACTQNPDNTGESGPSDHNLEGLTDRLTLTDTTDVPTATDSAGSSDHSISGPTGRLPSDWTNPITDEPTTDTSTSSKTPTTTSSRSTNTATSTNTSTNTDSGWKIPDDITVNVEKRAGETPNELKKVSAAPVSDSGISSTVTFAGAKENHTRNYNLVKSISINGVPCEYIETYPESKNYIYVYAISKSDIGKTVQFKFKTLDQNDKPLTVAFENENIGASGKFIPAGTQTIRFRAFSDKEYVTCTIRISAVPILSVRTDNNAEIKSKEKTVMCTVSVQDPDYVAHKGEAYNTGYATIRLRGASSLNYEKKPYKIELQKFVTDASGKRVMQERNAAFLGMRSDDDWTLDALYLDPTLMHNKLSYDLWQEIGGKTSPYGITNGPRCEYVEMYLNGIYHGLYLLVEPVDEKQTGVEKVENTKNNTHGILVKTTGWDYVRFGYKGDPTNPTYPKAGDVTWKSFEMKYPETRETITLKDWEPISNLYRVTLNGSDAEFTSYAGQLLDKENLVNYWIFISVTLARDNAGKNVYWAVANSSKPNYKMYIHAWDCDNSFGYRYGSYPVGAKKDSPFTPADTGDTGNYADAWFVLLRRYLENNVSGSAFYLQSRWQQVSKAGAPCNADVLCKKVTDLTTYLEISGAWEREWGRWPVSVMMTGKESHAQVLDKLYEQELYTKTWIQQRIPVVQYIVDNRY